MHSSVITCITNVIVCCGVTADQAFAMATLTRRQERPFRIQFWRRGRMVTRRREVVFRLWPVLAALWAATTLVAKPFDEVQRV